MRCERVTAICTSGSVIASRTALAGIFGSLARHPVRRSINAYSRGCWQEIPGGPLRAGSSPSTLTLQCRRKAVEQPLGSCSSTPGPDPKRTYASRRASAR